MPIIEQYHNRHYNTPIFFQLPEQTETEHNLYLGVELEVDTKWGELNNDISSTVRNCVAYSIKGIMPTNFIRFEHDGSLIQGFENITQPATFEYHKNLKEEYKQMFRNLRDAGLRGHQTRSAGLHVHFNRNFFDEQEEEVCVARLLYLVEHFWQELKIFSRRSTRNLDRWAGRYHSTPETIAQDWKNGNIYDRYRAVNLTGENTIEFRIFRSTLKWATYIATLELVSRLVHIVKEMTTEQIYNLTWEDIINTPTLQRCYQAAYDRYLVHHPNFNQETA